MMFFDSDPNFSARRREDIERQADVRRREQAVVRLRRCPDIRTRCGRGNVQAHTRREAELHANRPAEHLHARMLIRERFGVVPSADTAHRTNIRPHGRRTRTEVVAQFHCATAETSWLESAAVTNRRIAIAQGESDGAYAGDERARSSVPGVRSGAFAEPR